MNHGSRLREEAMKLKAAALQQIGEFICGDKPLPFPYRSSSSLTSFFTGLGLDYIHRNESRNGWARDAVIAINKNASEDDPLPCPEIISIIEEVLNPIYFLNQHPENANYDQALAKMNIVLKQYQLEVVLDQGTNTAKLRSIDGCFVSTAHDSQDDVKKITFAPKAFEVPRSTVIQLDLVAIMMPFDAAFNSVHDAIKNACGDANLRCKRADDIWANSTVVQDIFELILVANIVIVDFSGKNSNVMYETGIAHTLGKHVIPITQSIDHVPFDLRSHRVLQYHPNQEGLKKLANDLVNRLRTLTDGHSWAR